MDPFGIQCIGWELHAADRGLGMEVYRRLMVLEEFVAFGATNLETGAFEWSVVRHDDEDAAQAHAVNLTKVSEQWGCQLLLEPRAQRVPQHQHLTREWLRGAIGQAARARPALDELFASTMRGAALADAA